MNEKICLYKRNSFFSDDFPFSIRRAVNRSDYFNETKRFQREFWKITYIIDGEGEFILGDHRYPLHPASIILVHPGAVTTYNITTSSMELYNILFDPVFIEQDIGGLKDDFSFFSIFSQNFTQTDDAPLYVLESDHEMETLIRGMEREYEKQLGNYKPLLKFKLMELLILLLRRGERKMKVRNPEKITEYVKHLLESRYFTDFSLDDIARNIGITKSHLCRLYRDKNGTTIIEDLKKLRLHRAAEELSATGKSISEICYGCGFNDLSYFYRAFRDTHGLNPGDFRKKYGQY